MPSAQTRARAQGWPSPGKPLAGRDGSSVRCNIFFTGVSSLAFSSQPLTSLRRGGKDPRKRLLAGFPPTYAPCLTARAQWASTLSPCPSHHFDLGGTFPVSAVLPNQTHAYLCTIAMQSFSVEYRSPFLHHCSRSKNQFTSFPPTPAPSVHTLPRPVEAGLGCDLL